jgi:hypothetical protein
MTPARDEVGPGMKYFPARAGMNRKRIIFHDVSTPSSIVVRGSPDEKSVQQAVYRRDVFLTMLKFSSKVDENA